MKKLIMLSLMAIPCIILAGEKPSNKIFTDTKNNFSFEYSSNWGILQDTDYVALFSPDIKINDPSELDLLTGMKIEIILDNTPAKEIAAINGLKICHEINTKWGEIKIYCISEDDCFYLFAEIPQLPNLRVWAYIPKKDSISKFKKIFDKLILSIKPLENFAGLK